MNIEAYALTHQGKVRNNNEDNYYIFGHYKKDKNENQRQEALTTSSDFDMIAVFDGMGGEEAGEVASLAAVESVHPCDIEHVEEQAVKQLLDANEKICRMIRERNARMGTTAVQLYIGKDKAVCVNLGDSRGYLYRNGELKQLSKDHSEGQRMIDMGMNTEADVRKSNAWHKLTQHLGIFPEEFIIEPYISPAIHLQNGDIFLLCSDGLTDMLVDEEIKECLSKYDNNRLETIANMLLEQALNKGGKDNTTIVLLQVKDPVKEKKDNSRIVIMSLSAIIAILIMIIVFLLISGKKGNEIAEKEDMNSQNTEKVNQDNQNNTDNQDNPDNHENIEPSPTGISDKKPTGDTADSGGNQEALAEISMTPAAEEAGKEENKNNDITLPGEADGMKENPDSSEGTTGESTLDQENDRIEKEINIQILQNSEQAVTGQKTETIAKTDTVFTGINKEME